MLVKEIEPLISQFEQSNWAKDDMQLSQSALVHICRRLEKREEPYQFLELGGGASTLFWKTICEDGSIPVRVTTMDHRREWASLLAQNTAYREEIQIKWCALKQVNEEEWEELFSQPQRAEEKWRECGHPLKASRYDFVTINNTFYQEIPLSCDRIDVLIVNGPHGNGRSLAFPLLYSKLDAGSLILINDFDRHPYLQDLERLYRYEEIYRDVRRYNRWVLVRIEDRKQ
ncbi:hypothetical protein [Mechercharimyces sp. CAU 1602]|uniref:hypothetical protein n=1 Tax=Mechercharimyces sp. CAU 1602 TaxID=2973933 RepID=UPI0021614E66|nr:hypothetical protein [Mechercharimyces sp. CAU 1602]MCS1352210.1 hypothetical protein [Mechercharimyces sp. CAU 1602]